MGKTRNMFVNVHYSLVDRKIFKFVHLLFSVRHMKVRIVFGEDWRILAHLADFGGFGDELIWRVETASFFRLHRLTTHQIVDSSHRVANLCVESCLY